MLSHCTFQFVKFFSVELYRLACVFHPPPRSASGLAWWHLSWAQLEHRSHPTEKNITLEYEPSFHNSYVEGPVMRETPDHWPGPRWWWAVRCGWWPQPSWPDADACPPGCWWGRALPWFHWLPWCQTGPGGRREGIHVHLFINNNAANWTQRVHSHYRLKLKK